MSTRTKCGGSSIEARLGSWLGFLVTSMPFILPIVGWQFWYLRPFILYASILPYLFVPATLLTSIPCEICNLLGILDSCKMTLIACLNKFLWRPYMTIMHGYEVVGLENVPPPGKGALIVFYHGVIPMDVVFVVFKIFEKQGRLLGGAAYRGIFKIPLLGSLLTTFGFSAGGREKMIEDLKKGELRAVAPGGDWETMFSENYSVIFGKRCGFAIVAKEAGVPVIPMFTQNIREYQRCHYFGFRSYFRYLLDEYGIPALWGFGGLPVKLRTYLGEPMYCGENESPQEFANRVKKAIEDLRDTHQKLDNSMLRALMERFE